MVVQDLEEVQGWKERHINVMVRSGGQAMLCVVIFGVGIPSCPAKYTAVQCKSSGLNAKSTHEMHDAKAREAPGWAYCIYKNQQLDHVEKVFVPPWFCTLHQSKPKI